MFWAETKYKDRRVWNTDGDRENDWVCAEKCLTGGKNKKEKKIRKDKPRRKDT